MGPPARHRRALQPARRAYRGVRSHDRPANNRGRAGQTRGAIAMGATHRLVGYDRATDRMKVQFDIPAHLMPEAKRIANVPDDDPDAAWSYPLSKEKTRRVAKLIGAKVNCSEAEFFVEAF